jgi:hypothetical protein
MVGRGLEVGVLELAWRAAGQMVVVRGVAGIGKSRLVREFASGVRESGGVVLTGRCSATAGDVPLRPLREALLGAARSGLSPSDDLKPFLPALGAVVPDWAGSAAATGDRGAMILAEALLRLMAEWSATAETAVLVIEDLHWSDPETLEVVEYLADNLSGQPALVVVTVRDDASGAGAELISALEARRAVVSVGVGALDAAQSEAVVRECLGVAAVPPDLVDAVVARSDGIPFSSRSCSPLRWPTRLVEPSRSRSARRWRPASVRSPTARRSSLVTPRSWGASSTGMWWRRHCDTHRRTRSALCARRPPRSSSMPPAAGTGSATL